MKKLIKRYFPILVVISRPIRALTKKLIMFVINSIILIFSLFILKSKKITVVGGWFGERFADNSKRFYLYLNENLIDSGFSKVVLITRSNTIIKELSEEGYLVYSTWSFPSVWYHLRAKYHFIDQSPNDINPFFSVRSIRINLWHGFPLKKIGSFSGSKQLSSNNKIQKLILKLTTVGFWADFYLLATSEFSAEILGSAFGVDDKKIIISGYPRNYEPISDNPIRYLSEHEKEIYDAIKECQTRGHKIIGYFPTFRDKKKHYYLELNV